MNHGLRSNFHSVWRIYYASTFYTRDEMLEDPPLSAPPYVLLQLLDFLFERIGIFAYAERKSSAWFLKQLLWIRIFKFRRCGLLLRLPRSVRMGSVTLVDY